MTILRRVTDLIYRFALEHGGQYPTHILMTGVDWQQCRTEALQQMMIPMTESELARDPDPKINGLPIWFIEDGKPLAVGIVTGEAAKA